MPPTYQKLWSDKQNSIENGISYSKINRFSPWTRNSPSNMEWSFQVIKSFTLSLLLHINNFHPSTTKALWSHAEWLNLSQMCFWAYNIVLPIFTNTNNMSKYSFDPIRNACFYSLYLAITPPKTLVTKSRE